MKEIRTKISVTKLVFFIVMLCLCIFTGYQYRIGQEIPNKLRETVVTALISFYFGQKTVQYPTTDSLLKKTDEEDKMVG